MQYQALTRIKHDSTIYEPGSIIDLSSKEAEAFIGAGDITPVDLPFGQQVNPIFEKKAVSAPLVELPDVKPTNKPKHPFWGN